MSTVSVVMATYNGEKYIFEQLESLRKQTISIDEVIICDDCSKDNTVKVIEEYIANYDLHNWYIFKNKKNYGYAKNFIEATKKATKDIIFWCDQDDIWNEDKIKKMMYIIDTNEKINLLCSNLKLFYCEQNARKWDKKDLLSMSETGEIEDIAMSEKNFFLQRSGCTMCFRNVFFKDICKYWIDGWGHDDFIWKFAILTNSCSILQSYTMQRRMHSNNASSIFVRTKEWRINQLKDLRRQDKILYDFSKKHIKDKQFLICIKKNLECIEYRLRVIEQKKFCYLIKLITKYRKCYPRYKTFLLDIYVTIFEKYEGVN